MTLENAGIEKGLSIVSGVIESVSESLSYDINKINLKTKVIADLGADSLDFMDILFQLDRKFDISLQKEDFDLIAQTGLKKDEAIQDGVITVQAQELLREFLPELPLSSETHSIPVKDLGQYISIETIAKIVGRVMAVQPQGSEQYA